MLKNFTLKKLLIFTTLGLCFSTNFNFAKANDNDEISAQKETIDKHDNTALKVTALGLGATTIFFGLLTFLVGHDHEILKIRLDDERDVSEFRYEKIVELSQKLVQQKKELEALQEKSDRLKRTQNQFQDFLLKLKNDLLDPNKAYTARDLESKTQGYETIYWQVYNAIEKHNEKNHPHYEDTNRCVVPEAEGLKSKAEALHTEVKRLLEEYNPSIGLRIDNILRDMAE